MITIKPWPSTNDYWLVSFRGLAAGCIFQDGSNGMMKFHGYALYDNQPEPTRREIDQAVAEVITPRNIAIRLKGTA